MTKNLVILALTIVGSSAFAKSIPVAELDSYKQAVSLAIKQSPTGFECGLDKGTFPPGFNMESIVTDSPAGEIDNSGEQPLLIFTTVKDRVTKTQLRITTSRDYKNIASMILETSTFEEKKVNMGDLQNPMIRVKASWNVVAVGHCNAK